MKLLQRIYNIIIEKNKNAYNHKLITIAKKREDDINNKSDEEFLPFDESKLEFHFETLNDNDNLIRLIINYKGSNDIYTFEKKPQFKNIKNSFCYYGRVKPTDENVLVISCLDRITPSGSNIKHRGCKKIYLYLLESGIFEPITYLHEIDHYVMKLSKEGIILLLRDLL